MPTRHDPASEGRRLATRIARQIGQDLRNARLASGLSQGAAGAAGGMSHTQLGRMERGQIPGLTIEQVCRAGLAVGLRLGARLYPDGDAVRDTGQLRLLERFRLRLPAGATWRTEVPMPIGGDRRAWDAVVGLGGRRAGCEAETRLDDVQSIERRLSLKLRDGAVDVLILVVADTAHNRAVLRANREELRPMFPLEGRHVFAALAAGRLPTSNAIVVL
jgi:hypothetical protein